MLNYASRRSSERTSGGRTDFAASSAATLRFPWLGVFGDMHDHVGNSTAHMIVGRCLEDLLAVPFRAQNARGTQEAQMMADQGRRKPRSGRNVGYTGRLLQTGQDDPQPTGIADEPEHRGEPAYVVISN